ncbi:hypothetical protein [Actinosynnema sp. NPDC023587]|uniref:hypothetical protein n=1 Tax=Actinosynnema sp. NPDC023587 TaxID=3154695 RepID=UPI0033FC2E01
MSAAPPRVPQDDADSGDRVPSDRGRRYYRWSDPDTGEIGGYECLEPGGYFSEKRGKKVRWVDAGPCPNTPRRTPAEQ